MSFVIAFIVCLLLFLLFYFIGHLTTKELKIEEENDLLSILLKLALGTSFFLIALNLVGKITKSFYIGLSITLITVIIVCVWQRNELSQFCKNLIEQARENTILNKIKNNTDRYFWLLIVGLNLIYGLTAFSTTKLDRFGAGNKHVFNVNQLVGGTYPPKYTFLPSLDQKYHYGSDILGALISKFSNLHSEVSLDLLTIIFLNLCFLAFYALTIKFLNSNKINKYLVPFAALMAWSPFIKLFEKKEGEIIPQGLIQKIQYLTQNKLIDSASWSGLTLHWFFAPPIALGSFFFLIALYLVFKFFTEERNLKFTLMLGIFLSSLVIIDFSKFVLICSGAFLYLLLFCPVPILDDASEEKRKEWINFIKHCAVLFGITLVLGFIHGNWLSIGRNYIPLSTFFHFGTSNIDKDFNLLKTNSLLLIMYAIGFYQAYKLKQSWVTFLIPFFVVGIAIAHLITVPNQGAGKILMSSNMLGAFSFPIALSFLQRKLNIEQTRKLNVYYTLVFLIFGFSSLMFWGFGDKEKSLFKLDGTKIKYTGKQVFPTVVSQEESPFIAYLKKQDIKGKSILAEPGYSDALSFNTGLFNISNTSESVKENPVRIEVLSNNILASFTLDKKLLQNQKIHWLYLTEKAAKYLMSPESRKRFVYAALNNGVKFSFSSSQKELYEINPSSFSNGGSINSNGLKDLLKSIENKKPEPIYLKQFVLSPYYGVYTTKSNDFDGDKIADIAFFDEKKKQWINIYGKDQREEVIDLSKTILSGSDETDYYIPIPGDYDGDSKTDIALFNRNNGVWKIQKSSGSTNKTNEKFCYETTEIPLPTDLDGDGITDFSCYGGNNGGLPGLYSTNNYSYKFTSIKDVSEDEVVTCGDIDGDKNSDYITFSPQNLTLSILLSTENFSREIKVQTDSQNLRIVLGDYDGDNKQDIATWNPENGEWRIVYAKNILITLPAITGTTASPILGCGVSNQNITNIPSCSVSLITLGEAGDIPMPGDYNGDGKTDIAVFHIDTGELEISFAQGVRKKINLQKYKDLTPANLIGV